jgi:hypothetical protein
LFSSLLALTCLFVVATSAPISSSRLPKGYVCYRAPRPLEVNGRLDKPEWKAVPWTDNFEDIEGNIRPKPRHRTRVKMLWDDEYFYIGAELEEPHIWATLTEHDSVIFQDNDFEVFLDPDGDNHEYYEFEINALNTTWDLRLVKPYRDGGPDLNSWEIPGMKSAVWIDGTLNHATDTDKKWTIELAFPWKVLAEYANRPTPPHHGDQWRINFSRVEWDTEIKDGRYVKIPNRKEHNWVWSPQGVVDMHQPERWGYVQFSTAAVGKSRFQRDSAEPVRDVLMQIYHAQRDFHKKNKRWAASLTELGLTPPKVRGVSEAIQINLTADGYTAEAVFVRNRKTTERWRVRQDSRLWKE